MISTTTIPTIAHNHNDASQGGSTLAPAVLLVPTSAAPNPSLDGDLRFSTDEDALKLGTGASAVTLARTATRAEMEAETSEVASPSALTLRGAPSTVKAWGQISATGTLASPDYNVDSVTDTGVGDATIVIGTDFSGVIYACVGSANDNYAAMVVGFGDLAAGSVRYYSNVAGVPTDSVRGFCLLGDQNV